jgi:chorismate mutase
MLAASEGNVLTISQSIPLQGMANVVISMDMSLMNGALPELLEQLRFLDGVKKISVVGRS